MEQSRQKIAFGVWGMGSMGIGIARDASVTLWRNCYSCLLSLYGETS